MLLFLQRFPRYFPYARELPFDILETSIERKVNSLNDRIKDLERCPDSPQVYLDAALCTEVIESACDYDRTHLLGMRILVKMGANPNQNIQEEGRDPCSILRYMARHKKLIGLGVLIRNGGDYTSALWLALFANAEEEVMALTDLRIFGDNHEIYWHALRSLKEIDGKLCTPLMYAWHCQEPYMITALQRLGAPYIEEGRYIYED